MTRYISEATLKRLAEGSLEHIRYLLGEALSTLFPGQRSNILCTFPTKSIVVTEGGEFFTVTYAVSSKLRDVKVERLIIPMKESADPGILRASAQDVVSLLEGGDQQAAAKAMTDLVLRAPAKPLDEDAAADAFVKVLSAKRPWKVRVEGRFSAMRLFIGPPATKLDAARPRARFVGMSEAQASELGSAWAGLKGRLQMLATVGKVARLRLESVSSRVSAVENADRFIAFKALSEDFFDDLDRVHHALVDSARVVSSPRHLARMHDALAEELQKFELVGAFCSETVRRFEEELRR